MKTAQQLLDEVEEAISAVTKSQEFRLGDKWLTRANLKDLMDAREILLIEVRRENRGGAIVTRPTILHGC